MSKNDDNSNVRVAVRVRPANSTQVNNQCQTFTEVIKKTSQILLGANKFFTFDYVFDTDSRQAEVYDAVAHELVEGSFDGYNATIIAYGQTGSGKTYSMGSSFDVELPEEEFGIVPRALRHIYRGIEERTVKSPGTDFKISIQFVELYNEEIIDLLEPSSRRQKSQIRIHEDSQGGIYLVGASLRTVVDVEEVTGLLRTGCLLRTTGSTNMNNQSSRSHAIFSLLMRQERVVDDGDTQHKEILSSKFNFVDLAGSERLKRTGATGGRAKEGISINCGLFALGNVISALGDQNKRGSFVPYRDSKLTRLLQDSLGGNSRTIMLACVSPSLSDWAETSGTVEYANRARNIENKATVNQDLNSREINELRNQVERLKRELATRTSGDDNSRVEILEIENSMLLEQLGKCKSRIQHLQQCNDELGKNQCQLEDRKLTEYLQACGDDPNSEKIIRGLMEEAAILRTENSNLKASITVMSYTEKRQTSFTFNSDVRHVIDEAREQQKIQIQRYSDMHGDESRENSLVCDELNSEDNPEVEQLAKEIETKEKLIQHIEQSQKINREMEAKYHENISSMLEKIKNLEKEKSNVLKQLSNGKGDRGGERVKEEYERRISELRNNVQKYKNMLKEKTAQLRLTASTERDLQFLKTELVDLKRTKVNLMRKMRDETHRNRMKDVDHNKEVTQLQRKFQRTLTDNRNLKLGVQQKDTLLRRKQFEIDCLKRKNKLISGSAGKQNLKKSIKAFLEGKLILMDDLVSKMCSLQVRINNVEKDLFSWVKQQGSFVRRRDRIQEKMAKIPVHNVERMSGKVEKVKQLDSMIEFFDSRIKDCKSLVTHYQSKMNEMTPLEDFVPTLLEGLEESEDVRPLMVHMLDGLVSKSVEVEMTSLENRLLRARISKLGARSSVRAELLGDLVGRMPCNPEELNIDLSLLGNDDSDYDVSDYDSEEEVDAHILRDDNVEKEEKSCEVVEETIPRFKRKTALPLVSILSEKSSGLESTVCREKDGLTLTHSRSRFVLLGDSKVESLVLSNYFEVRTKRGRIMSMAADDIYLFYSYKDSSNIVWDLSASKEIRSFTAHPEVTHSMSFCPQLSTLAITCSYCSMLWDIRQPSSKRFAILCPDGDVMTNVRNYSDLTQKSASPLVVCPSGDKMRLYSASCATISVWDIGRRLLLPVKYDCDSPVERMIEVIAGGVTFLLAALKNYTIAGFEVYSLSSGVIHPSFHLECGDMDTILDMSAQNGFLVVSSSNGCLCMWDIATRRVCHRNVIAHNSRRINAVTHLPFLENTFVSGCKDGVVKVWDDTTFDCSDSFKICSKPVYSFATNSKYLFVGLDIISVWRDKTE